MCLLILLEWLPGAVSSKILFNVTNLDCVCNKSSTKRSLFNEARNAAKFPGLIPIPLMSAGEFPPCLVCWLGLIWVRQFKICLGQICRQVHCSTLLCQRVRGKSRRYRWEGSCLILDFFKSSNRVKGGKGEH